MWGTRTMAPIDLIIAGEVIVVVIIVVIVIVLVVSPATWRRRTGLAGPLPQGWR